MLKVLRLLASATISILSEIRLCKGVCNGFRATEIAIIRYGA